MEKVVDFVIMDYLCGAIKNETTMKTIVCGPPHSGKSVLISNLQKLMPSDDYLCIRANGDGEGLWTNNPNQKETDEVRKHNRTDNSPENFAVWRKRIENARQTIVIVDIGGMLKDDKKQLFEVCDSFIVISNNEDMKEQWIDFGENNGCKCIAAIDSVLEKADDITSTACYIEGRLGPLERGVPFDDSNVISAIADALIVKSGYKDRIQQPFKNNDDGTVTVDFNSIGERFGYVSQWTASNGVKVSNVRFLLAKAPELYQYLSEHYVHGTHYRIFGTDDNWVAAIAANALSGGNPSLISFFDPWTSECISPVSLKKARQPKNNDIDVELVNGPDAVVIHVTKKKGFINVGTFRDYQMQVINESKILLISGQLPTWFMVSVMMSYACQEVYSRIPGLTLENDFNYICVKSADSNNLGNIYQINSIRQTDKNGSNKPAGRQLSEELYRRIHDFLNKKASDDLMLSANAGKRLSNKNILKGIGFESQNNSKIYNDVRGKLPYMTMDNFTQRLHEITKDMDKRLKADGYDWSLKEGTGPSTTYAYKEVVLNDLPSEYILEWKAKSLVFKGFIGFKKSDNKTGKPPHDFISFSTNTLLGKIGLVKDIFYAIMQEKVITFDYDATNSNHSKHVVLSPHFLKEYNQRWFFWGYTELVIDKDSGYDRTNEKPREGLGAYTFRVDSVSNFRILGAKQFTYHSAPASLDYSTFFDDIVGVTHFVGVKPVDVYITTFDSNAHRRIKSKPLHNSQEEMEAFGEKTDNRGKFRLHVCINPELESMLFSFGDSIKVEWQGKSYKKFLKKIKQLVERYKDE